MQLRIDAGELVRVEYPLAAAVLVDVEGAVAVGVGAAVVHVAVGGVGQPLAVLRAVLGGVDLGG